MGWFKSVPQWGFTWKRRPYRGSSGRSVLYDSLLIQFRHPNKPGIILEMELTQDQRDRLCDVFNMEVGK
jgi:hypothetical protein